MLPWSMLSGSPRFGDALPAHRLGRWKGSVQARLVSAQRFAWLFALLFAWALADALRGAFTTLGWSAATGASFVVVPALAVAAVAGIARAGTTRKVTRPERGGLSLVAFLAATVGVAGALAVVVSPGGPAVAAVPYLPEGLLTTRGVDARAAGAAPWLIAFLVALAGGLFVRAAAFALDIAGTAPRRVPLRRMWGARTVQDLMLPDRVTWGQRFGALGSAFLWGAAFAGLLVTDSFVTVWKRTSARIVGRVLDRVHLDVDLRTLTEALSARGYTVQHSGRVLVVEMPRPSPTEVSAESGDAGFRRVVSTLTKSLAGVTAEGRTEVVRVRAGVMYLPPVAAASVLNLRGPPRAVARLRRFLETELLYVGTFAWSDEARRLERRLNGIAVEAAYAGTMEERAVLLEEATHLEAVAHARAFLEEEWTLLAAWKAVRLRALILDRMQNAPSDVKKEGRLVAPGATLPPRVERLVEAGGLAAVRAVVYVPHFVVPVQVAWGEIEFMVNAATGKINRAEGMVLLESMRKRGTRFFVDKGRLTRFAKRPAPGGIVYGEVRRALRRELGYWGPLHMDEKFVETVYVPYVERDDKLVNAVTGKEAPDVLKEVRDVLPRTPVA